MADPLFDEEVQLLRRNRAERQGFRAFLHQRTLDDILDRLQFVSRRFKRAVVIGPVPGNLVEPLNAVAEQVRFLDRPNNAADGDIGSFDLCLSLGWLDTVNDVPLALRLIRALLAPDALFAGTFAGNDSLPMLRMAMLAADRAANRGAAPRVHPRIDAAAVAPLLQQAGFTMPVVDVDRVRLRYRDFGALVADLRGLGGTNSLLSRSRTPLTRKSLTAARDAFAAAGDEDGTVETIELVHFAAWTPA